MPAVCLTGPAQSADALLFEAFIFSRLVRLITIWRSVVTPRPRPNRLAFSQHAEININQKLECLFKFRLNDTAHRFLLLFRVHTAISRELSVAPVWIERCCLSNWDFTTQAGGAGGVGGEGGVKKSVHEMCGGGGGLAHGVSQRPGGVASTRNQTGGGSWVGFVQLIQLLFTQMRSVLLVLVLFLRTW